MLETRIDRVRRTATVQEDWLAWLPEAKDTLFAFTHHELEVSYSILSVTLDDALTLCKQGMLLPARGQTAIFADLFERLAGCLRGVLRALYEHGHAFGTLANGFCSQRTAVIMGPCFRRDDGLWASPPLNQQVAEIAPFGVFALDQLDLPVTLPPLQLFLAGDGFVGTLIGFDIDKAMNAIGFDK